MKLTLKQMAERLNVSPKTFRKIIDEQNVPRLKVGNSFRFDPVKVEKHLEFEKTETALPSGSSYKKSLTVKPKTDRDRFRKELGLS